MTSVKARSNPLVACGPVFLTSSTTCAMLSVLAKPDSVSVPLAQYNTGLPGFEVTPDSPMPPSFGHTQDCADRSFCLPLSRNLNTFVGGRGAGKSAAIEALSFVCQPHDFDTADRKDSPDWYTRAKATLAGCNVRLCIQFLGGDKASNIPKRALFARRHFSQSDELRGCSLLGPG